MMTLEQENILILSGKLKLIIELMVECVHI